MTTKKEAPWPGDFQRCVDFHGHACPGLAMGYAAAKAGMAFLGEQRAEDEEIVAIVETDACGTDAIQVITGCTFGKGNFFFRDYGKTAFSFLSRKTGKGIRLIAKPNVFPPPSEYRDVRKKVENETATEEDSRLFRELHKKRVLAVLGGKVEDIYIIQEVTTALPDRAHVVDSVVCSKCGEPAMSTRVAETDEGPVCRACSERAVKCNPQ
jgi:formylmethanofuran dehydrogenase subunit E